MQATRRGMEACGGAVGKNDALLVRRMKKMMMMMDELLAQTARVTDSLV